MINDHKGEIHALERRERFLDFGMYAGMAMVFAGVVVENLPEFISSAAWVSLLENRVGGSAIAIGLAVEFLVDVMLHKLRSRLKEISDSHIAELNAETERLRQENNETALLLEYRSVDWEATEDAMRQFAGTKFRAHVLREGEEPSHFHWRLNMALQKAGWVALGPAFGRENLAYGIGVYTVGSNSGPPIQSPAAIALADWLHSEEIAVMLNVIADGQHEVGTVIVHVGPRPETIEQYRLTRLDFEQRKSRPVTPPQA